MLPPYGPPILLCQHVEYAHYLAHFYLYICPPYRPTEPLKHFVLLGRRHSGTAHPLLCHCLPLVAPVHQHRGHGRHQPLLILACLSRYLLLTAAAWPRLPPLAYRPRHSTLGATILTRKPATPSDMLLHNPGLRGDIDHILLPTILHIVRYPSNFCAYHHARWARLTLYA